MLIVSSIKGSILEVGLVRDHVRAEMFIGFPMPKVDFLLIIMVLLLASRSRSSNGSSSLLMMMSLRLLMLLSNSAILVGCVS